MVIEEPEHPLNPPVGGRSDSTAAKVEAIADDYTTIGQFYAALADAITGLPAGVFSGASSLQVVGAFPADQLFAIKDVTTALAGISLIVQQGEGTSTTPDDSPTELAQFDRFAQIANGRMLVVDGTSPDGWSYSGEPVGIDPAGVYNTLDDPKVADHPVGGAAWKNATAFNQTYTGAPVGAPYRLQRQLEWGFGWRRPTVRRSTPVSRARRRCRNHRSPVSARARPPTLRRCSAERWGW